MLIANQLIFVAIDRSSVATCNNQHTSWTTFCRIDAFIFSSTYTYHACAVSRKTKRTVSSHIYNAFNKFISLVKRQSFSFHTLKMCIDRCQFTEYRNLFDAVVQHNGFKIWYLNAKSDRGISKNPYSLPYLWFQ